MKEAKMLSVRNAERVPLADVPNMDIADFREALLDVVHGGGRVAAFFGSPLTDGQVRLYGVMVRDREGILALASSDVKDEYQSLTEKCAQFHLFEREVAEQWGVLPERHPWLKPVRFHHCYRTGHDVWGRDAGEEILPAVTDFFRMNGEDIHEVAVGPVHAGIIEPGHFRFQCHGEHVYNLEIVLGYQYRGIERALTGGPGNRTIHYMETLSGDTSIGHSMAYCHAVEALAGCKVPFRAQAIRGIMLELERLANHAGDLGAMANDIAYLPTASYCGRLRGDFLNMTALICGNRFGRGIMSPGGLEFDVDGNIIEQLLCKLEEVFRDLTGAVNLLWDTPSVVDRFERTGDISSVLAEELGIVGPAARACGIERDVRFDLPSGIYRLTQIPVSTYMTGDVFARAYVRWLEIQRSVGFIRNQLETLPDSGIRSEVAALAPGSIAVSLVEAWRGEVCHIAMTGEDGKFSLYKVVDPSFHNWAALGMALRGGEISDFPLCNKSFNLSYCGHDL